jgi:ribosomal protein L29
MITMTATAELKKKIQEELLEETNEKNIEELKKILADYKMKKADIEKDNNNE